MSCFPSCIKRPLITFIAIVVVLLIIAFSCCASGICKPAVSSNNIVSETLITPEPEIIIDIVQPDYLAIVRQDFIDNGNISNQFTTKASVFFDINKFTVTKAISSNFNNTIKDEIDNARLVIISGHACDLGNAEYNKKLIQKRINFVIDNIKSKNPAIEILFSNDGQSKAPASGSKIELQRKEERRVDVYFYK